MPNMTRWILFIYLNEMEKLDAFMSHIEGKLKLNLSKRDGLIRLVHNVFLFEETKAHGVLSILCAEAQKEGRTYMIVPIDPVSSLLAGTLPKDIEDTLKKIGVPFCSPLNISPN